MLYMCDSMEFFVCMCGENTEIDLSKFGEQYSIIYNRHQIHSRSLELIYLG